MTASEKVDTTKKETLHTEVQAFDKELKDDSNKDASTASQVMVAIQAPALRKKDSETEKNTNREINDMNEMMMEEPGCSFTAPHTKNENKASGVKESDKDICRSKMTEEQWNDLFSSVINLIDQDTLDSAIIVSR